MTKTIIHPHITTNENIGGGSPIIEGTRIRIIDIIAYYKLGYTAEDLTRAYPHLSLSQIYDALSYYYDNKKEVDDEIEANRDENFKDQISR
jgi:uncharacterized protein (DUF433 family)